MDSQGMRGSVIISDTQRRAITPQEEQALLPIINSLMSLLTKLKQYPTMNEIVQGIINEAYQLLHKWLVQHKRFDLAAMQNHLQVNNAVPSMAAQQKDFVQQLLFFMTERNIRSLEITDGLKADEFQKFVLFFSRPPQELLGKKNLSRALKRLGIRKINLSSEMVLDDVVIKTKIDDELQEKLSRLNVDELLEKANILTQLDLNALNKVTNLAGMVTNLSYTKNEAVSNKIIQRLARSFFEADSESRLHSAQTFSQIAEQAVDYTLYGLHSQVGGMMAGQLAKEENPDVFGVLAGGLEKSAQVLIAKGDYDEAMKLVSSLNPEELKPAKQSFALRNRAEQALENIASPALIKKLIRDIEGKDSDKRYAAVNLLGQMGKNAAPDLVDLLYSTEDKRVTDAAIKALGKIGQPAQAELYSELNEEMDDKFRAAIIRVIGEVGDVKSVVKLLPFLGHKNEAVNNETMRAMLKIGGPAAENKVLEALKSKEYSKEFFKKRLADFGVGKNVLFAPHLLEFLNGKGLFARYADPELQVEAVRALGMIGGAEVVAGLSELLTAKKGLFSRGKGNEKLETAACQALGRLGDPAAENALTKALKSKFPAVASAAKTALEKIAPVKQEEPTAAEEATIMAEPEATTESATIMAEPEATAEEATIMADLETVAGEPIASVDPQAGAAEPTILPDLEPTIEEPTFMAEPPALEAEKTIMPDLETVLGEPITDAASAEQPPVMPELDTVADELIGLIDTELAAGKPAFEAESVKPAPIDLDEGDIFADPGHLADDDLATLISEVKSGDESGGFRIVPTVGTYVMDGLRICIRGVDEQGKRTANQQGAAFNLPPGEYEVMICDQGMEVTKKILVAAGVKEARIDLQSIH